jgi:predicted amidophosphoribosyltransferase
MHLALVVILHELQRIGIGVAGHRMIEHIGAAAIIILLLLLIRRRKGVCNRCAARINRSADACPCCGVPHPFNFDNLKSPKRR